MPQFDIRSAFGGMFLNRYLSAYETSFYSEKTEVEPRVAISHMQSVIIVLVVVLVLVLEIESAITASRTTTRTSTSTNPMTNEIGVPQLIFAFSRVSFTIKLAASGGTPETILASKLSGFPASSRLY